KFETRALQEKLQAEQSQRRALENLVTNLRQKIAANDTLIGHLEEQRQAMAQEIQSTHQRRVVADEMNMAELNHSPPTRGQSDFRYASSSRNGSNEQQEASPLSSSQYQSRANSEIPASESDGGLGNSASSLLPLRSLEEAQRKCKELEDRLTQQDDTIKQLERSRSKFKRFAVKYEREIEQRDRLIDELRTSNASSFVSPDARPSHTTRSAVSSSSSSSSNSTRRRDRSARTANVESS
uniref:Uncharacterized protein n=1 Tax=Globisporangium ultimum (strain ATCC 200006 / CBS 805.95 / DAOM BR144) TaxID=431595 RepID=K3X7S9_GLOUD